MSGDEVGRRGDRARAFVPALIPKPEELDASGPLDEREKKALGRIHEARDHYGNARWMRGKALAAAFRRKLFRGEDGLRTRQEYLDDEWDGMSESAAYLEIREYPLAEQIAERFERPAADSHVRALVDVAEKYGPAEIAGWYVELRRRGKDTGRRVTEAVVKNLAEFLAAGGALPAAAKDQELDGLFGAPQLPAPRTETAAPESDKKSGASADAEKPEGSGSVVEPTKIIPKFWNGAEGGWVLSEEQIGRLSGWIEREAREAGLEPREVADRFLDAVMGAGVPRPWAGAPEN